MGEGDLQKCDYSIQGRVQIVKLPNPLYPLDDDPMTQIEVSIVCMKKLVCTSYIAIMVIEQYISNQSLSITSMCSENNCCFENPPIID